jgi:dethiobiotin synthetase
MSVFITGTDTDIGKTIISAWICLHTRAAYWKPIHSGNGEPTDRQTVQSLAETQTYPEGYKFSARLSPHAAASLEGQQIAPQMLKMPPNPRLVIEGSGGVLVPLAPGLRLIDIMQQWQLPTIVVARSTLGTINHTCLTLEALRHRGIPILGVIMNGPPNPGNKAAIEEYGQCAILAEFPRLGNLSRDNLETIPLPKLLRDTLPW